MSAYATSLLESSKQFVVEEALRNHDRAEELEKEVEWLRQKAEDIRRENVKLRDYLYEEKGLSPVVEENRELRKRVVEIENWNKRLRDLVNEGRALIRESVEMLCDD
jgi:hypothetical protein